LFATRSKFIYMSRAGKGESSLCFYLFKIFIVRLFWFFV